MDELGVAVAMAPDNEHLNNLLGRAQLAAGELGLAEQSFLTSQECGEARAIVGLGASQWHAGRWEEALVTLAQASAQLPEDPDAHNNFAGALAILEAQGVNTAALRERALALATCSSS